MGCPAICARLAVVVGSGRQPVVSNDAPVQATERWRLAGRLLGDPAGAYRTNAVGRQGKRMKAPEVLLSWGELIDKIRPRGTAGIRCGIYRAGAIGIQAER